MRSQFLSLSTSSSQASRTKQLTCPSSLSLSFRRLLSSHNKQSEQGNYNIGHGVVDAERAPSTAQEFMRVAEEKSRQGFASQTVEKAQDGAKEAAAGESTVESVKEAMKETPRKSNK